jgi:hypothetical protein
VAVINTAQSPLWGIPTGNGISQVNHYDLACVSKGTTQGMRNCLCKPSSSQLLSHHAGCDRGGVSRRLKPALLDLTVSSLRQAWLLGRLHRTSPVPFRGSYFTAESIFGSYAPTAHRLPVQPMGLRSVMLPSSIPPVRFVTHPGAPSLSKRLPTATWHVLGTCLLQVLVTDAGR